MQVRIKDEVKQIQVTSVILGTDYSDEQKTNLYIFHCLRCGSPLIQYQGQVIYIIPGLAPTKLPTVLKCSNSRCKHAYSFQAVS